MSWCVESTILWSYLRTCIHSLFLLKSTTVEFSHTYMLEWNKETLINCLWDQMSSQFYKLFLKCLFFCLLLIRPIRSFYCLSSALFSSWLCVRTSSGHLPTRTSYPPCAANTAVSAARSASSSTVLELVSRSL